MKIDLFYQSKPYASLEHRGDYSRLAVKLPVTAEIYAHTLFRSVLDMHGFWIPGKPDAVSTKSVVIESKSAGQPIFRILFFSNSPSRTVFPPD